MIQEKIEEWAKERRYRIGFADPSLLDAVKDRLARRWTEGEFATGFYEENLSSFRYREGSTIAGPAALLLAAVPRPAHTLTFELKGQELVAVLPPTYENYRPVFERVRLDLIKNALAADVQIETLHAPLKSLAAGIGLVHYGRNNITYAGELGSYFQLVGFVLDQSAGTRSSPSPEAKLRPEAETMLELCSSCRACVKACPTGAITEDRFLIHAERCYTLHSESKRPIPGDMRPPSPDCLVGCLRCQKVCPANKGLLKFENTGVVFTSAETEAFLLDGEIMDQGIRDSIYSKFETLGLTEDVEVFRRNLRRRREVRAASF